MKIICFLLWIATIIIGQIIGADQEDSATCFNPFSVMAL